MSGNRANDGALGACRSRNADRRCVVSLNASLDHAAIPVVGTGEEDGHATSALDRIAYLCGRRVFFPMIAATSRRHEQITCVVTRTVLSVGWPRASRTRVPGSVRLSERQATDDRKRAQPPLVVTVGLQDLRQG